MPQMPDAEFDIAAREAEVFGDGPRIAPLRIEDFDDAQRQAVRAIRVSAGAADLDDVPDYMRIVVKHPQLFGPHMALGNMLYNGLIPPRERELAILRVAWLCRAPFEWGQHAVIAQRCGLTEDEVKRARQGSAAPGWSAHEAAILRAVEELLETKTLSQPTWDALASVWSEAQLIEFPMMIGQYVGIAFTQNALRIPLDPGIEGLATP